MTNIACLFFYGENFIFSKNSPINCFASLMAFITIFNWITYVWAGIWTYSVSISYKPFIQTLIMIAVETMTAIDLEIHYLVLAN
jgi:hypothetical protein